MAHRLFRLASTTSRASTRAPGPRRSPLNAALLAALLGPTTSSLAQVTGTLPAVTVTGQAVEPSPDIGGFGSSLPLARSPFQAQTVTQLEMADRGVQSLAELTAFDASLGDAYNAAGYWSSYSIRGYVLPYRGGFFRNGLPISGETVLELANASRVEVLKGVSGIQAGTSAPGGLVNLVSKRPIATVRSATLGWEQRGTVEADVDLADRFGADQALGLRLNLSSLRLDPLLHDARGQRNLVAVAGDWRLSPDTLIEAELEHSHRSQASQPGFSLLGDALPNPHDVDPRTNLNDQPWSQPVVFDTTLASLRLTQQLTPGWKLVAAGQTQRLRTDDRLAYPFGCSAEGRYDRYCSDGAYDVYLFRSDNEHRRNDALDLHAEGRFDGALQHELTGGVLLTRYTTSIGPRPDDGTPVGVGNIAGTAVISTDQVDAIGLGTVASTNPQSRSTEWYLRDRIALSDAASLWAGVRHTRLTQGSQKSDGTEAISSAYGFTTPWLALSYQWTPALMGYLSWGQGIELSAAPNKAGYVNAGQPLAPLRSRQLEAGLKVATGDYSSSLAVFDIHRPRDADRGVDDEGNVERVRDGDQHHTGIEGDVGWRTGPWTLKASAMWLRARVEDSLVQPELNGKRPTNVPARTARLAALIDLPALPALQLGGALVYEGPRSVTPDNAVELPSWTRLDLQARYQHRVGATRLTWRAGLYNALDRQAWRESPNQYGHVYLYPMDPRTLRASVQVDF